MQTSLNQLLSYEHPAVINRFQREFPQNAHQAEIIFKDLLRFFWATEKHEMDRHQNPLHEGFDFLFIMDEEMKAIDQMWHVFLLYTQDYADFCSKYFNQYIHHLPDIVPNLSQDEEEFEKNLNRFLNYCYDTLGEETVRRWFSEN